MDREKAIQVLKRCEAESHCEHYKLHYFCIGCGQREALDLAIEALKQTETVRCKDCRHRDLFSCPLVDNDFQKDEDFCSWGECKEEKQVTGKLNNPDDSLLTEDSEACKEQKSKLDTDLISRQVAIEAMAPFDTNHELRDTLEGLPPVEPPKKVVAQIKVDTDELMERIKEEYEITEKPVCEDAISRKVVEEMLMESWVDGFEYQGDLFGGLAKIPSVVPSRPPNEISYFNGNLEGQE